MYVMHVMKVMRVINVMDVKIRKFFKVCATCSSTLTVMQDTHLMSGLTGYTCHVGLKGHAGHIGLCCQFFRLLQDFKVMQGTNFILAKLVMQVM